MSQYADPYTRIASLTDQLEHLVQDYRVLSADCKTLRDENTRLAIEAATADQDWKRAVAQLEEIAAYEADCIHRRQARAFLDASRKESYSASLRREGGMTASGKFKEQDVQGVDYSRKDPP